MLSHCSNLKHYSNFDTYRVAKIIVSCISITYIVNIYLINLFL